MKHVLIPIQVDFGAKQLLLNQSYIEIRLELGAVGEHHRDRLSHRVWQVPTETLQNGLQARVKSSRSAVPHNDNAVQIVHCGYVIHNGSDVFFILVHPTSVGQSRSVHHVIPTPSAGIVKGVAKWFLFLALGGAPLDKVHRLGGH